MKFLGKHFKIGDYSKLLPGSECVCVDWDAVRAEAMTQEERLYDETPFGHRDLTRRYRRAVQEQMGDKYPQHIRFKGKKRLFLIRKKLPLLPGLDKFILAEQVYEVYPDLEKIILDNEVAPEI